MLFTCEFSYDTDMHFLLYIGKLFSWKLVVHARLTQRKKGKTSHLAPPNDAFKSPFNNRSSSEKSPHHHPPSFSICSKNRNVVCNLQFIYFKIVSRVLSLKIPPKIYCVYKFSIFITNFFTLYFYYLSFNLNFYYLIF